jgi:hypothetical protein
MWNNFKDCWPKLDKKNRMVYTDGKGLHFSWPDGFISSVKEHDWPIKMQRYPWGDFYTARTTDLTHWMYMDQFSGLKIPDEEK